MRQGGRALLGGVAGATYAGARLVEGWYLFFGVRRLRRVGYVPGRWDVLGLSGLGFLVPFRVFISALVGITVGVT